MRKLAILAYVLSTLCGITSVRAEPLLPYSLDGSLEVREVIEQHSHTPHERTRETLRLHGSVDLMPWLRCEGSLYAVHGGATFQHTRSGVIHQWDTFQDVDPAIDFDEAFCGVTREWYEVKVGKQKFAWGKLDHYQPNDLLNPERYIDPFLQEEDERKIGVPAVSTTFYPSFEWLPDESKVTFVWEPMHTPPRFLRPGERWFPPAATVPSAVALPSGFLTLPDGSPSPAFSVPVEHSLADRRPSFHLDQSSWAMRASGLVGKVDTALYYYHGIDPEPSFQLDAMVSGVPDTDPASLLGVKNLLATTQLRPSYHLIDSFGADAAYPLGDFTIRAEMAYIRGRAFNRDFSSVLAGKDVAGAFGKIAEALRNGAGSVPVPIASYGLSDVVEWGIGGDFVRDNGMVLLQINQSALLNPTESDLLVSPVETRILLNTEKEFPEYHVTAKFVAVHAIESDYTVLLPRVSYEVLEGLKLEVGYLMISGRRHSIVGQYKDNDQAFVRAIYTF